MEQLEVEISEIEKKINELEELMCNPDFFSNPQKSKEIHQETTTLKQKLEKMFDEWVKLT